MAGLAAAARLRELGAPVRVLEKGDRPGGSMLLSSGVIWRYRDFDEFRRQCPGGDPELQRVVWERLDDALDWLPLEGEPYEANPLTTGRRYDPHALTRALAGDVEYGAREEPEGPVIVATGGYPVRLARERRLLVRANPWSEGDGIALALRRGAEERPSEEFYGRAMPGPVPEEDYVRASQLYGRFARVVDDGGVAFDGDPGWSENALAQWIASRPGGRAWFELDAATLERPEVQEKLRYAQETDGPRVRVYAAVTHTYGGVKVDTRARAADGVWAAGVDVGGISNGGYSSGLAQALVLGLTAAEDAAGA